MNDVQRSGDGFVPAVEDADFSSRVFDQLVAPTSGGLVDPRYECGLVESLMAFSPMFLEYRPVSAWAGHYSFLHGLIWLLRPKRFVELGTHFGGSFFAACQAVRDSRAETECVAVDHWRGDSQAGFFDSDVFSAFRRELDKYLEFAGFVRKDFDSALGNFCDGSIDLLHIDGFHTYQAVSHDFRSWRSKLSPNALVLLHDVNEYQRSFGVWEFWRELVEEFPDRTLFFGHSHGLGIVSLAESGDWLSGRLVEDCQDSRRLARLQYFYDSLYDIQEKTTEAMESLGSGISELESLRSADAREMEALRHRCVELEIEADSMRTKAETLKKQNSLLKRKISRIEESRSWRWTSVFRRH